MRNNSFTYSIKQCIYTAVGQKQSTGIIAGFVTLMRLILFISFYNLRLTVFFIRNSKLKKRAMFSILSDLMLKHFNTPFLELHNIYATQYTFNDPATSFVASIIDLHHTIFFYLIIVSTIVLYLLFYLLFFGSSTKNKYSYFNHNTGLEVIWTLLPSVIISLILLPSLSVLHAANEILDPSITVKIVGHQWYWSYEYSDNSLKNLENNLNLDSHIKANWLNVLAEPVVVLPVQTNIRFLITSDDVIHSWSLPAWGIKMDVIPGTIHQVMLSINKPGLFYGQCSEICGVGHGFMPITIEAVSNFQYLEWLMQKNYILSNLVSSQTLPYSDSGAIEAISSPSLISHDNPKLLLFLNHEYDSLALKNVLPENEQELCKISFIKEYLRCCVFNKGLNNFDDINAEELNTFLKTHLVKLSADIIKDSIFEKAVDITLTEQAYNSIFNFLKNYKAAYRKNQELYDDLLEIDSLIKQALDIIKSRYYSGWRFEPIYPGEVDLQIQRLNCNTAFKYIQIKLKEMERNKLHHDQLAHDFFIRPFSKNISCYKHAFSLLELFIKHKPDSSLKAREEAVHEAADILYKSYKLRLIYSNRAKMIEFQYNDLLRNPYFLPDINNLFVNELFLRKIISFWFNNKDNLTEYRLHLERARLYALFNNNYLSPSFKGCFNQTTLELWAKNIVENKAIVKECEDNMRFVKLNNIIHDETVAAHNQMLSFLKKICKYHFSPSSEKLARVYSVYDELNGDESFYDSEMLLKKCIRKLDEAIIRAIKNSEVSDHGKSCKLLCNGPRELLDHLQARDQY